MAKVYHHIKLLKMDSQICSEFFCDFYVERFLNILVSKCNEDVVWNDLDG